MNGRYRSNWELSIDAKCCFGQERSRTEWRLQQRYGNQTDILEPYYDVVDDQEIVHNVHIHPAKPINDEREYAGIHWGVATL